MTAQVLEPLPAVKPAPRDDERSSLAAPPLPVPRRSHRGRWLLLLLLLALGVGAAVLTRPLWMPAQPVAAPTPAAAAPPKLTARGEVRPIARAKIGALTGGTVTRLSAVVGDWVEEQEEIARVRGSESTEVLTAPWRGTITSVPVRLGDTVIPGTTVATVGDLTRYEVETTDVDEFIIRHLFQGQTVNAEVDALDRRAFPGQVRTVALLPEKNESGDDHYPVVIDLVGATRDLRLGMTVRLTFAANEP